MKVKGHYISPLVVRRVDFEPEDALLTGSHDLEYDASVRIIGQEREDIVITEPYITD